MPSKAALDVVRVILCPFHVLVTEQQYQDAAAVVDEHLGDLLDMLEEQTCSATCGHADCDKIRQALEPWKPEKKTDDTPKKSA